MVSASQSESESSAFEENKSSKSLHSIHIGNRRKFACVECRQQKSKCDAYERAPEPCTKCAKKGVPCVLQKDFRRTYKRARNEAIEKRFKELTRTLTNLSSEEILQKIKEEQSTLLDGRNFTKEKIKQVKESHKINPQIFTAPRSSPMPPQPHSESGVHVEPIRDRQGWDSATRSGNSNSGMTQEQLECTPKSLGDVFMSSETISELFQEFATKYHIFLPVVDLSKGAERIYNLSPCLFWVILLIGLRRKFGANETMTKLSVLVKSILAEITISPIIRYTPSDNDEPILNVASVFSVQAFLLYTFWPPLTSSLSADTSWNTIGTAMFQAIRVGLNCAEFSKEYATENSELINEKVRTWVSCNVVSQVIASSFGFPAYVSFDHTVMNATRVHHADHGSEMIPASISHLAQIAHFENQMISTMNSNPANALGMVGSEQKQPLLNVLNQQLNQLEVNLEDDNLDNIRKFLLLVAKVHLLTYYFTDAFTANRKNLDVRSMSLSEIESNFETKRGLVRVYNATIELLLHATNMWRTDPAIIKYFPGVFVLNIWQSACIISKLAHSSLSAVLDVGKGKKAYQDAVSLTFNASVLKHDMAYRSSGIMKSIWSMFSNMYDDWKKDQSGQDDSTASDFNLGINIKSRMSVSVFFDCLYILREKCGMARIKRETQRYEEYEDEVEEYEDEVEEDDNVVKNSPTRTKDDSSNRGLSESKHPEESARKIIKTVPLDPNPINATNNSSCSSLASPNSQAADVLSLEGILNKNSPKDDLSTGSSAAYGNRPIKFLPQNLSSNLRPVLNDLGPQNKPILGPSTLGVQSYNMTSSSATAEQQASSDILQPPYETQSQEAPDNQLVRDSPHNIIDHWDNWESDTVWKDVDLLMNEFAFNPTG